MLLRASRTMWKKNFREHDPLQAAALRNSKVLEELFVDYGENFLL